uniref:SGNH hydrolase-type esterase domain-containing protein n=1 Tax=Anabas testudineus TaxID=64144 RepID=A0A3Q1IXP2_ANATE
MAYSFQGLLSKEELVASMQSTRLHPQHISHGNFPRSHQHRWGTLTSQVAFSTVSRQLTPTLLIIGDTIIRDVLPKSKNCLCFPQVTVSDLMAKLPDLMKINPTQSRVVIQIGSNDIKHGSSELLKKDFLQLFDLLKRYPDKRLFISGPIPQLRYETRLFSLHEWLKSQCSTRTLIYIDNFDLFWNQVEYYKKDGRHPNRQGSQKLTSNILYHVSYSPVIN